MTSSRAPVAVARVGVGLAARLLPSQADRDRYGAEFLADLHGMSPSEQFRHAAGVLSQTFALRAALGDAHPNKEEEMLTTTRWRRLRCRLGLFHDWTTYRTEDGNHWQACAACGKDRPDPGIAPWIG